MIGFKIHVNDKESWLDAFIHLKVLLPLAKCIIHYYILASVLNQYGPQLYLFYGNFDSYHQRFCFYKTVLIYL